MWETEKERGEGDSWFGMSGDRSEGSSDYGKMIPFLCGEICPEMRNATPMEWRF